MSARRIFTAVTIALAVLLGALGWRFVSEQARTILGSVLASDNLWGRIPAENRADFERRIEAIAGELKGMSKEEAGREVEARVQAGMPRLDDATLVRRLTLQTTALGRTDDVTCAGFAQASFGAQAQSDAVATKLLEALTEAELTEWFNVAVLAMESDARKSPAARTVSEAEVDAVFERMFQSLDTTSLEQIQAGAEATSSPAEACLAARTLYDGIERLPVADRRLIALADVTP